MEEKSYIDLATLQDCIKDQVDGMQAWIKAELDSCKYSGGHYYLGLIQKDDNGKELAKARAVIWRSYASLVSYFKEESGKELQAGITVLILVQVSYDARYGMTLVIKDIDADYTVGQREMEKQKTIKTLGDENLIDRQKGLALPFLPGRIAVISSADAAGYGDFVHQLENNQYGFRFNTTLFPALMQGDSCPSSIKDAVKSVFSSSEKFSLLVILRGGGAESDLFCYDDLELCRSIATCPLPILTAIGHERDFHIADIVANSYFKTPTALAAYLVDWVADVEENVRRCVSNIRFSLSSAIRDMEHSVNLLESRIYAADPRNILKQGYVLASDADGRIIKSASQGNTGDNFTLSFSDGTWACEIKSSHE